ncbi:MAG: hypothetical protein ACI8RD_001884, partial [Bacillariaceae sp.]
MESKETKARRVDLLLNRMNRILLQKEEPLLTLYIYIYVYYIYIYKY